MKHGKFWCRRINNLYVWKMSNGFFTSILLLLAIKYWYFTLIALLIKFALIRFITTNTNLKAIAMWVTGTFIFFAFASIGGFVFSSANIFIIPLLMFALALTMETIALVMIFSTRQSKTFYPLLISNSILFFLLFLDFIWNCIVNQPLSLAFFFTFCFWHASWNRRGNKLKLILWKR